MSQGQGQIILVTGANGYTGAHIVDQLVKGGYRVRGTVRSSKVDTCKKSFSVYGDKVEIVALDDYAKGVYPEIIKDVYAVIHSAAALPGKEATVDAAVDFAIDGSINLFKQAEKAGVRKFSFCSSIAAHSLKFGFGDPSKVTEDQWNPITREDAVEDPNPFKIYLAEKVLSEKAVWEFADQHPHIEMATVSPTYFFGPFAPGQKPLLMGPDFSFATWSLSSLSFFWQVLIPDGKIPSPFMFIDVRDVARALIEAALNSPPHAKVGRKRILVSSDLAQAKEVADLIRKERPFLTYRLNKGIDDVPQMTRVIFNERFNEVLGFELTPWKKTILDAVDALVELENYWKAKGKPLYDDRV